MSIPESTAVEPRRAAPSAGAGAGVPDSGRGLDLTLLAVAVSGVSLSAPLIASTAAPALAIAFWRNAMAVGVLSPVALWRHRGELRRMGRRALGLSVLAGLVLALHFGLWLPSLNMTSVATSTALCTTTPIWTTLILRARGHHPPRLVWAGTALAVVGAVILTGIDLSTDTRALVGDSMALGAGLAAAVYMLLGAEVRRTATTTAYTFVCYATTAAALLCACLVSGSALAGYDGRTWLKIAALTVAAQLLGHSLLNRVVRGLGPSTTSTAILLETPGAALIAGLWLGQTPPAAAYPALAVILGGLALVILSDRRR
ncbi:Permease of the drug/metabolite transporter (DMT) superfamily [Actinacidiphila yanglinensis]|uniref:Permease of the drug/metabolite transporter (DMT) superfamily n=1 Tax=Actinacidiphila yanglinensis TaxID=310779 RepID=A0A1H5V7T6_9ACTN|nr:Permease of the drug/metabolite transporter (DMT) superfamily [Actinacidiphila yanglinensis]